MEENKPNNPQAFPAMDMTLRDYFAAKAMQSYVIICEDFKVSGGYIAESSLPHLARYSYEIADAMLKARQS